MTFMHCAAKPSDNLKLYRERRFAQDDKLGSSGYSTPARLYSARHALKTSL